MSEFEIKQERMRALMAKHNLDALLLQRVSSFAWATCGAASYVNTAVSFTGTVLLVTLTQRYLITNNIEAPRLEQEEQLAAQGWRLPNATLARSECLGGIDPRSKDRNRYAAPDCH